MAKLLLFVIIVIVIILLVYGEIMETYHQAKKIKRVLGENTWRNLLDFPDEYLNKNK